MTDANPILPGDSPACCLGCHYPLRDLTVSRCPECGREFDPNNPTTMYLAPIPSPAERFLLQPPGWPFHMAAGGVALSVLLSAGLVLGSVGLAVLTPCCGVALGGIWLLRLIAAIGLALYYHDPVFKRVSTWRRWLTAPMLVLLSVALPISQVPLRITFALSQPAMEQLAQEVRQTPVGTRAFPNRRVGVYTTRRIERIEGGMRFLTAANHMGLTGFAYCPNGPPPPYYRQSYRHFGGPWYVWDESY